MLIATCLRLAAAVVLAVLATMTALVLWTIGAVDRAATARRNARELLLKVELALSDLRDTETGQRGYLLTGSDSYLAPFQSGIHDVPKRLSELELATSRVDQLRSRVAQLAGCGKSPRIQ
jgi:CHASE3 domain sensor protein